MQTWKFHPGTIHIDHCAYPPTIPRIVGRSTLSTSVGHRQQPVVFRLGQSLWLAHPDLIHPPQEASTSLEAIPKWSNTCLIDQGRRQRSLTASKWILSMPYALLHIRICIPLAYLVQVTLRSDNLGNCWLWKPYWEPLAELEAAWHVWFASGS